ncbi:MAG: hypothetical protein NTZ33_14365 [Bacteroidetes bacterium]|nr:hypothetical protein [Bacteroidota bacterium]
MRGNNSISWTAAETDFLYENKGRMSMIAMSETLGKTETQVYAKIWRLNFKEQHAAEVKKQFLDYMPAELDGEVSAGEKRKKDYGEFFENYKPK